MMIRKLEISEALGFHYFERRFNPHRVFVVQGCEDCPVRRSLCTAVQLLCDPKFASTHSLIHLQLTQQSYVAMVFFIDSDTIQVDDDESTEDDDTPCTSSQAAERLRRRSLRKKARKPKIRRIWVHRHFLSDCDALSYRIDSAEIVRCCPKDFHKVLGFNEINVNSLGEKSSTLFGRFTKLYMAQKYEKHHILMQLGKCSLIASNATHVIQGNLGVKVFQDTRKIFEYLTFESATVWFMLPYMGDLRRLEHITVKNLNFDNLVAFVQRLGHKACDWTTTSPVTQDLLRIAYQLAAAIHFKERIIYLNNLETISTEQAQRYGILSAASKFMKKELPAENIIQRIVNTCNEHSIAAFIDYPGGMPYKVTSANVFMCGQVEDEVWVVNPQTPNCTPSTSS